MLGGTIIATLGQRIKSLRRKKKLTLAEMAEMSQLSASHLSQIEQDKTMPSLLALANIAEVLSVNPRDLLEAEEDQVYVTRTNYQPEEATVAISVVNVQLTSPVSGSGLEVYQLILQPEAASLVFEPHPGEVFGFVLTGKLAIVIEDEQIELEAGDSIHYDADQPYRLSCCGDEPCTVIWCGSPPRNNLEAKIETVSGDKADVSAVVELS